ncbi:hypothetical protein AX17_004412 [Amanita inopinata Kibby_2008]|nr:hypothetical protein AX17_004412 [Amanita inopinata Kibby_2008]
MGAHQSKADGHEKVFQNKTAISFSEDVVNQLADHLSSDATPERQSNVDTHIRSRIHAEMEHLRREEEHVRQQIESALEKENLDRERAMATDAMTQNEITTEAIRSSAVVSEDLEYIQSKIDRFQARKRSQQLAAVKSASEAVLSCYR